MPLCLQNLKKPDPREQWKDQFSQIFLEGGYVRDRKDGTIEFLKQLPWMPPEQAIQLQFETDGSSTRIIGKLYTIPSRTLVHYYDENKKQKDVDNEEWQQLNSVLLLMKEVIESEESTNPKPFVMGDFVSQLIDKSYFKEEHPPVIPESPTETLSTTTTLNEENISLPVAIFDEESLTTQEKKQSNMLDKTPEEKLVGNRRPIFPELKTLLDERQVPEEVQEIIGDQCNNLVDLIDGGVMFLGAKALSFSEIYEDFDWDYIYKEYGKDFNIIKIPHSRALFFIHEK